MDKKRIDKKILKLSKTAERTAHSRWKLEEELEKLRLKGEHETSPKIMDLKNRIGRAQSELEAFEDGLRELENQRLRG